MDGMNNFKHLPFPRKIEGKPFYRRPNIPPEIQTQQNRQNRYIHGNTLKRRAVVLSAFWHNRRQIREHNSLPTIKGGIPFLLQIDPSTGVGFLCGLGFEVVCDLEDGFIIVASEDIDLTLFQQKIDNFINNHKKSGTPSKVYGLSDDNERLIRILSKSLYEKWSTIDDTSILTVDISIECNGLTSNPNLPSRRKNESDENYTVRCRRTEREYREKIDQLAFQRQEQFQAIALAYDAEIGSYIHEVDSFSVRTKINGNGLRDLVHNFGYIFEVTEVPEVKMESSARSNSSVNENLIINPPLQGSPIICVIDSGIQENHIYLSPALLTDDSVSFVPNEKSNNDLYGHDGVTGGHGTRVAGAILYQNEIPINGNVTLPYFIRNARVLNGNNQLPIDTNPSQVISEIVNHFFVDATDKTKIYNHSIGEGIPFEGEQFKHMSLWAAKIDDLSYEYDILFVQAAGNITEDVINGMIVGLNKPYPLYFSENPTRLSNPSQSLQAITVGSISHSDFENDDYVAIGKRGEISSFSRIGPGIWDSIKPDVVEYGGTHIINKRDNTLTTNEEVCPDLIRTSPQGPAHARDGIGTSFAAPKIAHILGAIQRELPSAPALLYRALLAQAARLPKDFSQMSREQKQMLIRQMGYGLPDIERATQNNDFRTTFITTQSIEIGMKEAHVYSIYIPDSLRNIGDDYNILVEITLSYAAKPRRTLRRIKHYMSTWLDWICSKIGETEDTFRQRLFETDTSIQDDGAFNWAIRERDDWGDLKGFNRKAQTLQKDWCTLRSSQLSDAFCVAVRGHEGWGSLYKAKYALSVSFEAIDQNIEIYNPIRLCNQVEINVKDTEVRIEIEN